jgi:hypothetical protein
MKLSELIAEQWEKLVHTHARPHLERGEDVVGWVRTRHPDQSRRHGYAYLTTRRLLVVWSGHADPHGSISLGEIESWDVDRRAEGGPLLGIRSSARSLSLLLPVSSHRAARSVSRFLRKLARLAPRPGGSRTGSRRGSAEVEVTAAKLSPGALTKRILVTLAGVVLIAGGTLIAPIPGPWSLPVVLAGLAVLASEYDWAADVLGWVREKTRQTRARLRARRAAR